MGLIYTFKSKTRRHFMCHTKLFNLFLFEISTNIRPANRYLIAADNNTVVQRI